jgi:ABC-type dipeptide/oligopeptide/nickel transport system permease subunit
MADPQLLDVAVEGPGTPAKQTSAVESKSPTRIAFERLRKDKIAVVCAVVVLIFILIAVLADVLIKITHTNLEQNYILIDPQTSLPKVGWSAEHPFGVEPRTGRDIFARWVMGARYSMIVGFAAAVGTTALGVLVGLAAGFLGGWVDRVSSWIIDYLLSLPFLLMAIALAPIVGSWMQDAGEEAVAQARLWTLVFILLFFGWTGTARLIRGQVFSLRESEFVQAARAIGVPTRSIMLKELLPNLIAPIVVSLSLALPAYIGAEAGLSFLGVGLIEPTPSWGRMISSAQSYVQIMPEYLWLPLLGLALLTLSLNLLGDAVRDAFDPKTRR